MAEPTTKTLIKLDGKDFEYGSAAHVGYLETRCDAKDKEAVTLKSSLDALQARFDAAESKAKKAKEETDAAAEKDKDERAKKAKQSRSLRRMARKALRALEDLEDKEEDEEKMDALEEELDDLSDREVMERVIRADSKDFDGKAKSDDYISARFDATMETVEKKLSVRTDGIDSVVRVAEVLKIRQSTTEDPEAKARAKFNADAHTRWQKPVGAR